MYHCDKCNRQLQDMPSYKKHLQTKMHLNIDRKRRVLSEEEKQQRKEKAKEYIKNYMQTYKKDDMREYNKKLYKDKCENLGSYHCDVCNNDIKMVSKEAHEKTKKHLNGGIRTRAKKTIK